MHAYSASKIKEQNLNSRNVTQLKSMMVNQKSQGFLVDFRLNQVDNHPLDFVSSKKRRGSRDADYVKTREQRRRIVPLDRTLIQGRYQQARDTFGNNVAQGVESLSIEVRRKKHVEKRNRLINAPLLYSYINHLKRSLKLITSGRILTNQYASEYTFKETMLWKDCDNSC